MYNTESSVNWYHTSLMYVSYRVCEHYNLMEEREKREERGRERGREREREGKREGGRERGREGGREKGGWGSIR